MRDRVSRKTNIAPTVCSQYEQFERTLIISIPVFAAYFIILKSCFKFEDVAFCFKFDSVKNNEAERPGTLSISLSDCGRFSLRFNTRLPRTETYRSCKKCHMLLEKQAKIKLTTFSEDACNNSGDSKIFVGMMLSNKKFQDFSEVVLVWWQHHFAYIIISAILFSR